MSLLTTIVAFIFSLGVLIFFHELGHFLLAKRAGVRVEKFSLGFGKKLWSFRPKDSETEYMVSALPLGGYVKMTGEDPEDAEGAKDPKAFCNKSILDRFLIVVAGPTMNLLLPFLLMPMVYLIGIEKPAYQDKAPVVGWVDPEGPGAAAGIQAGDLILSVEGKSVDRWKRVEAMVGINPGHEVDVVVDRAGHARTLRMTPALGGAGGMGYGGLYPEMKPVVAGVSEGSAAEAAGLKQDDVIAAIDGAAITNWMELRQASFHNPGKELTFTVRRGEETLQVPVTPAMSEEAGGGLIGVLMPSDSVMKKLPLRAAIREGAQDVVYFTKLTVLVMVKLFSFELPLKSLGGPVMIAQVTGQAAAVGIAPLLYLMGLLSV
ncbi:MAG: RIP metalloprotease RseP, partial [Candidatus Methylomirabilis sp.]|nr:RIP metalloprotease RseP [Deltaproteobacteria bacterium]